MIKMKRSQLKALIKECLVEILRDDVILQKAVSGTVNEVRQRSTSARSQRAQPASQLINPLDDQQMTLRQEALMQRNQLMKQSNTMNKQRVERGSDMEMLAGLDEGPTTHGPGGRQNRADTGVMNPSDYIRLAQERSRPYSPMLDSPPPGAVRQQQRQLAPQNPRYEQASRAPSYDGGGVVPEFSTDALRMIFDDPSTHSTVNEQAARGHVYNGRVEDSMNGGGASAVSGDRFDMAVSEHLPDELFPDSAGRWANLAF